MLHKQELSLWDPSFVVKGEVQKAVNVAQGLFQRWIELLQAPSKATRKEIDWATSELRHKLRRRVGLRRPRQDNKHSCSKS
uniref:Syntaxin 6/10/61 N-terminal domain-containing protein n=1 Tax=Oryctolagus cuniculus TaxID=9986 RepID=A0A5F9D7V6_RABIT